MSPVQYPAVIHCRCSAEMLQEFKERGGARWLRRLIEANTRPVSLPLLPAAVDPAKKKVSRRKTKKLDKGG